MGNWETTKCWCGHFSYFRPEDRIGGEGGKPTEERVREGRKFLKRDQQLVSVCLLNVAIMLLLLMALSALCWVFGQKQYVLRKGHWTISLSSRRRDTFTKLLRFLKKIRVQMVRMFWMSSENHNHVWLRFVSVKEKSCNFFARTLNCSTSWACKNQLIAFFHMHIRDKTNS